MPVTKTALKANDFRVGQNLRRLRRTAGFSQEEIGKHIRCTDYQVQKYESGTNRIAPSRLVAAAEFLGCEVAAFFAGTSSTAKHSDLAELPTTLVETSHGRNLLANYEEMTSQQRAALAKVAAAIADNTTVREQPATTRECIAEMEARP